MPGPNRDPVKHIRKGCPTPLKFVLCLTINSFTVFSRFSLLIYDIFSNSFRKSFTIFLEELSRSLKSSAEISILS